MSRVRGWALTAALVASGLPAGSAASAPGWNGTYRATVTAADLRAVGTPVDIARVDAGTWTLVLADGRWTLRQAGGPYGNAVDKGDVVVSGPVADFTLTSSDGHPHHVYDGRLRWRPTAAGLRFSLVGREREDVGGVLAARPWARA
jgi:hypothetical protein